jgi:hypothetical protein
MKERHKGFGFIACKHSHPPASNGASNPSLCVSGWSRESNDRTAAAVFPVNDSMLAVRFVTPGGIGISRDGSEGYLGIFRGVSEFSFRPLPSKVAKIASF